MQFPSLLVLPLALALPASICHGLENTTLTSAVLSNSVAALASGAGNDFSSAANLDVLGASNSPVSSLASLPDAPDVQSSSTSATAQPPQEGPAPKQTKRILFIIPNFRSVTADEKLPPTTTKEKFKLALLDSFDYSAFIEVGILAGLGQIENSEPEFHQGAAGYARYYWHSFADNLDGDLWVEAIIPTVTREDPRYYTLGHGGFFKRTYYSVSRLVITRDNNGNPTPNFSEVVGNGIAAGISETYYPSSEMSWTKTGQHWITQIAIDGLSNVVKEFWPEVNQKLFHDKY